MQTSGIWYVQNLGDFHHHPDPLPRRNPVRTQAPVRLLPGWNHVTRGFHAWCLALGKMFPKFLCVVVCVRTPLYYPQWSHRIQVPRECLCIIRCVRKLSIKVNSQTSLPGRFPSRDSGVQLGARRLTLTLVIPAVQNPGNPKCWSKMGNCVNAEGEGPGSWVLCAAGENAARSYEKEASKNMGECETILIEYNLVL